MTNKQGIAAYRSGLRTASPLASVVMLYDGVLTRIGRAAASARRDDTLGQLEHVMRAVQILNGLNQSLDMAAGGSVALSLRDMYGAVAVALYNSVGRDQAVEACDKLAAAVRKTRNAWAQIAGLPQLAGPADFAETCTRPEQSGIVEPEQELLRDRTSKKSEADVRDHVRDPARNEPGGVPGLSRPVRRRSGEVA
ncbi:MAG TPA: flagellar export chaperone FliS [Dongiaceae bacterium]|jgi:flagellar protein FliS|nr:flagellar export chaperone FliS [Dongiaceae bacterium]